MTTDHGPQRQPASVPQIEAQVTHATHELIASLQEQRRESQAELARLRAENERYAKVCKEIVNLTAFTDSYVGIYIKKLAADALRGEGGEQSQ